MKFKRIISLTVATLTAFSIVNPMNISKFPPVHAEQVEVENTAEEKLIPYLYEDWHDFTYESIIIVLKREYGELNKLWNIDDFSISNISRIEDLTYMNISEKEQEEYLNKVDFHQILRVYLEEQSFESVISAIDEFENYDYILAAEPNFTFKEAATPNDPHITSNYYAFSNTQLYAAWDKSTGSNTVKVGIIDSGISDVSDLSTNVNYSLGKDFVNDNSTSDDINGHGTEVASVVGAVGNNSMGVCGVCWNVTLVPLQVWGGGVTEWIEAITYAETKGIPILNLSYTVNGTQTALKNEINKYTGLFVCSAGNNGINIDTGNHYYPACLNNKNIITVASSTANDQLRYDSNYGATSVDLAAPGDGICVAKRDGTYGTDSGTSFASPMVAGTAALLLSYNPNLTCLELKEAIINSVDTISSYIGNIYSGGSLNVLNAINYVKKKNYAQTQNQYQNIVVKVDKTNTAPINQFNFNIIYYKNYQKYSSTIYGNVVPSVDNNEYWANPLRWEYSATYSGSNISSTGHLFTARFKANVNSKKSVFEDTSIISCSDNLNYMVAVIGDINDDGLVDNNDKYLVQQYILYLVTFDSRQMLSADVNFDGIVNMSDAILISQYETGAINSFF